MRLYAYTLYDSKAQVYGRPFFAQNIATAIRSLEKGVNDHQSLNNILATNPEDFALFELGYWHDDDGRIEGYEGKKHIIDCIDLVKAAEMGAVGSALLEQQAG